MIVVQKLATTDALPCDREKFVKPRGKGEAPCVKRRRTELYKTGGI